MQDIMAQRDRETKRGMEMVEKLQRMDRGALRSQWSKSRGEGEKELMGMIANGKKKNCNNFFFPCVVIYHYLLCVYL